MSHRRLPRWVLVRDTLITLLAWVVLAYLLRDLIYLAVDYFGYPFFKLTKVVPPDMALIWARLKPYIELIAFFMVWLLVSVLVWRIKVRSRRRQPQPEALLVLQHAGAFGLDAPAVVIWQQQRVLTLQFSSEGHMASAQAKLPLQTCHPL